MNGKTSKNQKTNRGQKQTSWAEYVGVKPKYQAMATWTPKGQRGAGKR